VMLQGLDGTVEPRGVAAVDRHVDAFGEQRPRDGVSDSFGGTADECRFSGEVHVHASIVVHVDQRPISAN
jgi:hypothetical protein